MELFNNTVKDYLLDESFQRWVLHPDVDRESVWDVRQRDHPECFDAMEEARLLLLQWHTCVEQTVEEDEQQVWSKLAAHLDEDEEETLSFSKQPEHKS
ncbi:hypothetical protein [Chryseolinea lacunae]|uniref:Uncharacterized protein n=1 Tax=Chryseolinea lacunae TaxID=2801331 RepID=A0ABS1L0S2_9BACT|nr:hypothetical protein [Chryseolinea lacunae]MBL0745290.1 hypothetical protein [Chryseolinea lacunae]